MVCTTSREQVTAVVALFLQNNSTNCFVPCAFAKSVVMMF